ncbi:MAG: homocysteine S-methyltransferase family protein [Spirochaetaceae bacterium]|nr:MAG: homocysteine S-methyltransferase family protein [Spirochaetaceae bacterium]
MNCTCPFCRTVPCFVPHLSSQNEGRQGCRRDYVHNLAAPIETNKYSVEEWLRAARKRISNGVQIIGGYCGIGLEYIEALSAIMKYGVEP